MLKRVYNYVLPALFCGCFILSFVFEAQRIIMLILSLICLLIAAVITLFFSLNLIDKPSGWPIILISIAMLNFGAGKYNFEVDTIPDNNYGYVILAVIAVLSLCKIYRNHLDIKKMIIDFILYAALFLVLCAGGERYFNYGFDLSKEKQAELIIEKQIDDGHCLPGYDYVFITYKVKANDLNIKTIDISDQFKLIPGDRVKVVYREGMVTPLYSTEYDVSMWVPAPPISDIPKD